MSRHGKTKFARNPRDYYRTWDTRAIPPLMRFVQPGTPFVEFCAGAGDLVDQLVRAGLVCHAKIDIEPQRGDIQRGDMFDIRWRPKRGIFCSNPPWRREILHAVIRHFAAQGPTYLLFDAAWLFNDGAVPFLPILHRVVGTPRLIWMPGTNQTSTEDTCWYHFDATIPPTDHVEFYGRTA